LTDIRLPLTEKQKTNNEQRSSNNVDRYPLTVDRKAKNEQRTAIIEQR
jgi:hypothetical protein